MKIIFIVYLITAIYVFIKETLPGWWLKNSVLYLFRRRRIDRLFSKVSKQERRDLWLYSLMEDNLHFWFERRLERYIYNKYINDIIKKYGSI